MAIRRISSSNPVLLWFVFSSESWLELSETVLTLVFFHGIQEERREVIYL